MGTTAAGLGANTAGFLSDSGFHSMVALGKLLWRGSFVASKPRNEALVAVGEGPGEGGWQVLSTSQSPVLRSKLLGLCWPGVGPFGSPAEKPGGPGRNRRQRQRRCPSERYTQVPSPVPVNAILLGKSVFADVKSREMR